MQHQTTIAAIATPLGRGGVGVIRLSGPKAYAIAEQLTQKNFLLHVWRVSVSFVMPMVR
jgi:tRNA U34 5-carboxymethylaminomethyl modifying GTPase MnmE/TrmE